VDDVARLFMARWMSWASPPSPLQAGGPAERLWLWGIYVLLVLAAPVMVAALAGWGFVDIGCVRNGRRECMI